MTIMSTEASLVFLKCVKYINVNKTYVKSCHLHVFLLYGFGQMLCVFYFSWGTHHINSIQSGLIDFVFYFSWGTHHINSIQSGLIDRVSLNVCQSQLIQDGH